MTQNVSTVDLGGTLELTSLSDFQNAVFRLAFIWHHNKFGGFLNLGGTIGNCCFKLSGSSGNLNFGGDQETTRVYPATFAGVSQCGGTYSDTYVKWRLSSAGLPPFPLPHDYFDSNTPMLAATSCTINSNPGFFVRRRL